MTLIGWGESTVFLVLCIYSIIFRLTIYINFHFYFREIDEETGLIGEEDEQVKMSLLSNHQNSSSGGMHTKNT